MTHNQTEEEWEAERQKEYEKEMEELGKTYYEDIIQDLRDEAEKEWQEELEYRKFLLTCEICKACQDRSKQWCKHCLGTGRIIPVKNK